MEMFFWPIQDPNGDSMELDEILENHPDKLRLIPEPIQRAVEYDLKDEEKFNLVTLRDVLDQPGIDYPGITRTALSLLQEDGGYLFLTKNNDFVNSIFEKEKDPIKYVQQVARDEFHILLSEDEAYPGLFRAQKIPVSDPTISSLEAGEVKGGIDFNRESMNLQTKGDNLEFIIPPEFEGIDLNSIEGFVPVIIQITPITNIFPLLGLTPEEEQQLRAARGLDPAREAEKISLAR
jgi:hypothetical protein